MNRDTTEQRVERAREAMGHWADLRSGEMYQGDVEEPHPGTKLAAWILLFALIGLLGLIAGIAFGDVPEFLPGPGLDVCMQMGC